jgi:hypothetical protein
MITLPYKNRIVADDILRNIKDNDGKCFTFTLIMDWAEANYASLNNKIDDIVEEADLLGSDIVFIAKSLDDQIITFEVVVNDVSEFLNEYGISPNS